MTFIVGNKIGLKRKKLYYIIDAKMALQTSKQKMDLLNDIIKIVDNYVQDNLKLLSIRNCIYRGTLFVRLLSQYTDPPSWFNPLLWIAFDYAVDAVVPTSLEQQQTTKHPLSVFREAFTRGVTKNAQPYSYVFSLNDKQLTQIALQDICERLEPPVRAKLESQRAEELAALILGLNV